MIPTEGEDKQVYGLLSTHSIRYSPLLSATGTLRMRLQPVHLVFVSYTVAPGVPYILAALEPRAGSRGTPGWFGERPEEVEMREVDRTYFRPVSTNIHGRQSVRGARR